MFNQLDKFTINVTNPKVQYVFKNVGVLRHTS